MLLRIVLDLKVLGKSNLRRGLKGLLFIIETLALKV